MSTFNPYITQIAQMGALVFRGSSLDAAWRWHSVGLRRHQIKKQPNLRNTNRLNLLHRCSQYACCHANRLHFYPIAAYGYPRWLANRDRFPPIELYTSGYRHDSFGHIASHLESGFFM